MTTVIFSYSSALSKIDGDSGDLLFLKGSCNPRLFLIKYPLVREDSDN